MGAPETLHVLGTGGAKFDMDVPPEATQERELFLQRLASGDLVALDDDGDPIDRVALIAELTPAVDVEVVDTDPLAGATVKELRAYAEDHGIELGDANRKADILEVIRAAEIAPGD